MHSRSLIPVFPSPVFFPVFLGACFVSAGFGLGIVEKNEILLLFFLPSLIVESWKSTALFFNSFPTVDKASGEEKKKTKQKEKTRSLFWFCRFWLWSCRD